MATHPFCTSMLAMVLALQGYIPLRGQAPASWSACKTDSLSTYNCSSYYSGTVGLTSTLKTPDGSQSRSVAATITSGRVSCRVRAADGSAFEGAGMLVAEHAEASNAGKYTVRVWCPETAGQRLTRDDYPAIDTYEQVATSYAVLEGKDSHEHPDADAANGVTGTETITWSLHR